MPSKIRMIQAIADQEVSELSDDMVRLAAAKDAEIAALKAELDAATATFDDEQAAHQDTLRLWQQAKAEIAALKHDIEQALASLTGEANALDKADAEIATLTEQRDRAMAERNETRDRTYGTIRQLREQRDRAMAVVEDARTLLRFIHAPDSIPLRNLKSALAALDAEVAAETAPSLPETPEA